uniref:Putative GTPase n=1 Tax=Paulinella micropora TaxID=1928728 RepID=A0A1L5YBB0_9EUKA|nr:putative GTPase [Paulinella micropora]
MSVVSSAVQFIPETTEKQELVSFHDYLLTLHKWRHALSLNAWEHVVFGPEVLFLDQQIFRLEQCYLKVAVVGRTGVGKSSLLNALSGKNLFTTSVRHGSTQRGKSTFIDSYDTAVRKIELIDTPGIDEFNSAYGQQIAIRIAQRVDLLLFVIDSDLTKIDLRLLQSFVLWEKPIIIVLNRIDRYSSQDKLNLIRSIRKRLPSSKNCIPIIPVAASPRQAYVVNNNFIRSFKEKPRILALQRVIYFLLENKGQILLTANALQSAHQFNRLLCRWRLQQENSRAVEISNIYTTLKAVGVILTPGFALDLVIVFITDTCLSLHLAKIYRQPIDRYQTKRIIHKISTHSAFLGASFFTVQVLLKFLEQMLITSRSSLDISFPINTILLIVTQICLALYTSRSITRLVRLQLLNSSNILPKLLKGNPYDENQRDLLSKYLSNVNNKISCTILME